MGLTPTGKRVDAAFKSVADDMAFHYERWLDESEYEDINDYGRSMFDKLMLDHRALIGEATLIRSTKRPFGFVFEVTNGRLYHGAPDQPMRYHFFVNSKHAGWKRVAR